ncbi:hypothetical protein [Candidatus Enterovibrio escicola]|uniref:hypothetical protein n=1 Tax=Candidatus Enterovibrio escicola TaxID=1927127 RepID=UPI003743D355
MNNASVRDSFRVIYISINAVFRVLRNLHTRCVTTFLPDVQEVVFVYLRSR